MAIEEIRPAWTRTFLDEEESILYHITRSSQHYYNGEPLYFVEKESSSGYQFIGLLSAFDIEKHFKIVL